MKFGSFIGSTAMLLHSCAKSATVTTTVALSYKAIHATNDGDIKDLASNLSSTVSTLVNASTLLEIFHILLTTPAWQNMSKSERTMFIGGLMLSLGGSIYSMTRFGVEHNTLAAGLASVVANVFSESQKLLLSLAALQTTVIEQDSNHHRSNYSSFTP